MYQSDIRAPGGPLPPVPLLLRTGLASTPLAVRDVLETVQCVLIRAGAGPGERMAVEIALAEALNNIVEHAYGGSPLGWIDVTVRRGGAATVVELRDAGVAFDGPGPQPMQNTEGADAPADLPEGGFGRSLIANLTRSVQYRRSLGENHLRLDFPQDGQTPLRADGEKDAAEGPCR